MSLTYVFIKAICLSSYHWRCKWKYPTLKNSRTSVNSDKDMNPKSITGSFDLNWMKDTHTAVLIQFIVYSVVFLIIRYLSKMVRRLGLGEFFFPLFPFLLCLLWMLCKIHLLYAAICHGFATHASFPVPRCPLWPVPTAEFWLFIFRVLSPAPASSAVPDLPVQLFGYCFPYMALRDRMEKLFRFARWN